MLIKRLFIDPVFFNRVMGPLAVLIALTAWAASFSVGKILYNHIDPITLTFIRIVVAGIVSLPILIVRYKPIDRSDRWSLFVFAILALPVCLLFQFYGLTYTSASVASLAIGLEAPFVMLWMYILYREKTQWINIIIAVKALIGLALVVGEPEWGNIIGVLLILAADAAFALATVISKRLFKKYDSLYISSWMFLIASIVMWPIWMVYSPITLSSIPMETWYGLLYLGVIATLFAQSMWNWGVSKISAVRAAQFVCTEPLLGAIIAIIWLGDYWYWGTVVGAFLIVSSMVINAILEDDETKV